MTLHVNDKNQNAIEFIISNKMIESLKIILTLNVRIENISEKLFVELIRNLPESKIVTNYYAIDILIKNDAKDILCDEVLEDYCKYKTEGVKIIVN